MNLPRLQYSSRTLVTLSLLTLAAANAEPPPPRFAPPPPTRSSPQFIVLNSPCAAAEIRGKLTALPVAAIGGQSLTPTAARPHLAAIDSAVSRLHEAVIPCWSAEAAFYSSGRKNRGKPGDVEAERYNDAIARAHTVVTLLPKVVAGENSFDRDINATIAEFFEGQLDSAEDHGYLPSVIAFSARLSDALDELAQTSLVCRIRNRREGATSCLEVDSRLAVLETRARQAIADLAPKVTALTKTLDSAEVRQESLTPRLENARKAVQKTAAQVEAVEEQVRKLGPWATPAQVAARAQLVRLRQQLASETAIVQALHTALSNTKKTVHQTKVAIRSLPVPTW